MDPTERMTNPRHVHRCTVLLGLLCLTVTACNRWQASSPPLNQRSERVRVRVTETVEEVDEDAAESPSDSDPRRSLRPYYEWSDSEAAADSLGRMGAAAVPNLITALQDPNPSVRALAARVLARIGPEAVIAVPALTQLLEDSDADVRRAATRALGQIGPGAAESVPELIRLLEEPDPMPNASEPDVSTDGSGS